MHAGVRIFKQLVIAGIVLAALGAGGFFAFRAIQDPLVTPTPDPRATLAPVEIVSSNLFVIASGDYDFLAKVKNPNAGYGSPRVNYELTLLASDGNVVEKLPGTFYIFPGQVKQVLVSPIRTDAPISRASMRITQIEWEQLDELALQGINFVATDARFSADPIPRIRSSILNNSDFDIAQVDVVVLLVDAQDRPIAANRTEIRTFGAGTTRGFETAWILPVENPARVIVEANANLFLNDTFVRTYGSQEKFQQMY